MHDHFSEKNQAINRGDDAIVLRYIETPHIINKPEKIDTLLEKRMREFLLSRRQRQWQETGE